MRDKEEREREKVNHVVSVGTCTMRCACAATISVIQLSSYCLIFWFLSHWRTLSPREPSTGRISAYRRHLGWQMILMMRMMLTMMVMMMEISYGVDSRFWWSKPRRIENMWERRVRERGEEEWEYVWEREGEEWERKERGRECRRKWRWIAVLLLSMHRKWRKLSLMTRVGE